MIPKRVVLENFLSFGSEVDLKFDADEPLWVLCGPNGIGKSAVFDAITYALFGCHRGGKGQGMDRLIRHGTNGFRVEFEFTFAEREYRIIRNYGKKSVERVYTWGAADWQEVELPTGKNKVRDWAERALGLTYDQFTASVLLKQGEADKIITGTGKERLEMLKKIIGVERFEALSKRVKDATGKVDAKKQQLTEQLKGVSPVTDEELEAARAQKEVAEGKFKQAQDKEAVATARVEQARQFEKLEVTRNQLEGYVKAADERRAKAKEILEKHNRLSDLDGVVSTLRSVTKSRDERQKLEPERDELLSRQTKLSDGIAAALSSRDDAKTLREKHQSEVDRIAVQLKDTQTALDADRKLVRVAEEVETIDAKLVAHPANWEDLIRDAEAATRIAESEREKVVEEKSASAGLLKTREEELAEFDTVEVGAKCSRCGQKVTETHAKAERERLEREIARLRESVRIRTAAMPDLDERVRLAKREYKKGTDARHEQEKLADKKLSLLRHHEVPAVAVVKSRIEAAEAKELEFQASQTQELQKALAQKTASEAFETNRKTAERDLKACQETLRAVEQKYTTADTQVRTLVATLRGVWLTRWETLPHAELDSLAAECETLKQSGIAEQHRLLQDDNARRGEWDRQLAETRTSLDEIPVEARVTVAEANEAARIAKQATAVAGVAWDIAKQQQKELNNRAELRAKLVQEERAAEKTARLHEKLDGALGAEGLQRDLVRSAERQIVKFANETVRNLSDGDLTIELDDAEDGPDKAFTLKVRRADMPEPIGVNYLSGSQKFRVAVAVALAIGRFATSGTQARPLESVIIDEGFGSLDKDGLRAMSEELKRLEKYLKRIILVSHQEDFTNDFRARIHLRATDTGTTAEKVRR